MGTLGLAELLSRSLGAAWPRRRDQELLLDLGERKRWRSEERDAALAHFAGWLSSELGIPARLHPAAETPAMDHREVLERATRLLPEPSRLGRSGDVGRARSLLAEVLGTAPKTLSNSLRRGLRADRADHRLIRLLARIEHAPPAREAVVFHARTRSAVAAALAAMDEGALDTADALLLHSLVALWQRRRPSSLAKGSRAQQRPRRLTPKPIAALDGVLLTVGQLERVHLLSMGLLPDRARALVPIVIECALQAAHLAAHLPRRARSPGTKAPTGAGESWLAAVLRLIEDPRLAPAIDVETRDLVRFRIARMRAYRDRLPPPSPPNVITAHPYVAATLAIDRKRGDPEAPGFIDPDAPGVLMLRPQARRLGLFEPEASR